MAGPSPSPATPAASEAWHAIPAETVAARLETDVAHGLAAAEVARRHARGGPNVLRHDAARTPLAILAAQFRDVMVLVLVAAAIVAGVLGERDDVIAILAIVVLNALLGFVQEYRAERAMAALGALAAPTARVRRDGAEASVAAAALVPGDVVLLEAGNVVPADIRLVDAVRLAVEEAALTGESQPSEKDARAVVSADAPVGDRLGMAFKGTTVTAGRAVGVVVATGMRTELGRIAAMLAAAPAPRTPLQRKLDAVARRFAVVVVVLCAIIFGVGLARGEPPGLMFMTALSLAVAAIPEALPAVVTVSLALGARRMARRRALVRRLPAVETLGAVTVICSDKTGTLTENRMRVETVRRGDGRDFGDGPTAFGAVSVAPGLTLAEALALCTDVAPAADDAVLAGDPTETALVRAARTAGADVAAAHTRWPRTGEAPFSAERARMTTVHRGPDGTLLAITKGAPERVVPRCTTTLTADGPRPLDAAAVLREATTLAAEGLRVLTVAVRRLDTLPVHVEDEERDLVLVALVGQLDPPRAAAVEAVRSCREAGIRVVMITGDHPATARAIAARLGLADAATAVLTGREIAALDDDALVARAAAVPVHARVAPEDKLRLVGALQARGELVAMTGDGVNDAPALRRADIGVAMGRGGTDVAREAADMVLLDDDFATIVGAVAEGRRIHDNIRRFVRFVLATNAGEIATLFLAPVLGLPLPLLPIHILWMNLVTDGVPGVALSAEPAEADVMARPPRDPAQGLFADGLWQHAVRVGLLMAGLALGTQWLALDAGNPHWRTMTFTVLTFAQLAHVLAIRSERRSLLAIGIASNRPLLAAVLGTVALQLAILYLPALQPIFRTTPLPVADLATCVAVASVVLLAVEVEKALLRRAALRPASPRASRARPGPGARP